MSDRGRDEPDKRAKKPRRRRKNATAAAAPPPRRHRKLFERRGLHRPGTAPGTLSGAGELHPEGTALDLIGYGPESFEERRTATFEDVARCRGKHPVVWVNAVGLGDAATLERLGELFGLHPLALEDVVHVGQRPKSEDYGDHRFVVMRLIHPEAGLAVEQLSLFFGSGFLITFQERPGDIFDPVRERLRKGRPRIRGAASDYLAYALIDALVDQFFPLLETFGERLEDLEQELIDQPAPDTLQKIYRARRELLELRRAAWPQREVIHALERDESDLITKETKVFLRDAYDHIVQILDMIETFRELAAGMLDVYLSSISNRMNEVMKVLTIMATIFIPLTFIAGIYGMNFDPGASRWNMPELDWAFGYPAALAVMAAVGLAMVAWFRKKGWL